MCDDPLPSSIGQEEELGLGCGLARQRLVQLHHTLVKIHTLLGYHLELGDIALRMLVRVIIPQLSYKRGREGERQRREGEGEGEGEREGERGRERGGGREGGREERSSECIGRERQRQQ